MIEKLKRYTLKEMEDIMISEDVNEIKEKINEIIDVVNDHHRFLYPPIQPKGIPYGRGAGQAQYQPELNKDD